MTADECRDTERHRQGRYPLHDVAGIFVAYVCDRCERAVRARYAPHVFGDSLAEYERETLELGDQVDE